MKPLAAPGLPQFAAPGRAALCNKTPAHAPGSSKHVCAAHCGGCTVCLPKGFLQLLRLGCGSMELRGAASSATAAELTLLCLPETLQGLPATRLLLPLAPRASWLGE